MDSFLARLTQVRPANKGGQYAIQNNKNWLTWQPAYKGPGELNFAGELARSPK